MAHHDPRTSQSEMEVHRILDLQQFVASLPDSFTNTTKVTRSDIPAANVPVRLEIPKKGFVSPNTMQGHIPLAHVNDVASASAPTRKRERPMKSTDDPSAKRQDIEAQLASYFIDIANPSYEIVADYSYVLESQIASLEDTLKIFVKSANMEFSLSSKYIDVIVDRSSTVVDDIFA